MPDLGTSQTGQDGSKPKRPDGAAPDDGSSRRLGQGELSDKSSMAMVGLLMTTFLMNPGKFFSAMQATMGGPNGMSLASLTDPALLKGLSNMMGALTDHVVSPSQDMTRVQNSALMTMNTQPNFPNNATGLNTGGGMGAPGAGLSSMTPTGPTTMVG